MTQKPKTPSGTRDFLPMEMVRRNYIFDTIRSTFILHGFEQIETPAMEQLSTLLGKYGEEGDKLLYKILNSGNPFENISCHDWQEVSKNICEKGLRYDLTVPFARYVVQHRNDLVFPFRRFQIQPVWRADRPQKGRYREFFQCDIDIVGSKSLYHEAELIEIADEIFHKLDIGVTIKINNRKILTGIAHYVGCTDKLIPLTIAIDKIEKIGFDKVKEELIGCGFGEESVKKLYPLLYLQGSTEEKLASLEKVLQNIPEGLAGIMEIREIFSTIQHMNLHNAVELDLSLARGLHYYTGAIFEIKAKSVSIGSISGGGRYDELTELFGLSGMSGVGISFGLDRIYDVLLQLDKFKVLNINGTDILFLNWGAEVQPYILCLIRELRKKGIRTEYYSEAIKIGKQFDYANKRKIMWVGIVGSHEASSGTIKIKNMETGEQITVEKEKFLAAPGSYISI